MPLLPVSDKGNLGLARSSVYSLILWGYLLFSLVELHQLCHLM